MAIRPISAALRDVLESLAFHFCVCTGPVPDHPLHTFESPEEAAACARELTTGDKSPEQFIGCTITRGELAPSLYAQFKEVLALVGGRWDRRSGTHRFSQDPRALLADLLAAGHLPDANPFDYFPTPLAVVQPIIEWLQRDGILGSLRDRRESGDPVRALEPQSGCGGIAVPLAHALGGPDALCCVEINPINRAKLAGRGFDVVQADFLNWVTEERFPLIVMNPPFDGQTWQKHLRKAFSLLELQGHLVCIAPASVLKPTNTKAEELLRWILRHGSIETNPEKSFHDSGTDIDTVTIFMRAAEIKREEVGGWPSWDACHFDMVVSSTRLLHEQWTAAVQRLVEELGDALSYTFAKDLIPRHRDAMTATIAAICRRLLLEEQVCCDLLDEDVDALIDTELANYCLENGITRQRPGSRDSDDSGSKTPPVTSVQTELLLI